MPIRDCRGSVQRDDAGPASRSSPTRRRVGSDETNRGPERHASLTIFAPRASQTSHTDADAEEAANNHELVTGVMLHRRRLRRRPTQSNSIGDEGRSPPNHREGAKAVIIAVAQAVAVFVTT